MSGAALTSLGATVFTSQSFAVNDSDPPSQIVEFSSIPGIVWEAEGQQQTEDKGFGF